MKTFPVTSTSVMDPVIARLNRVMARTRIAAVIRNSAVFVCKFTAGTTLYSAHAFGKAADLMLKVPSRDTADKLRRSVVRQCTKRTLANFGRPVKGITFVIGGTTQWIRDKGDSPYPGVPHDTHVHAATMGSTTVRPPCADPRTR